MPQPVKLIVASDSGCGKTGGLASLAEAGYSLRIADLDNNSAILRGLLTNPDSPYVRRNAQVGKQLTSVVPITEPRGLTGGKLGIVTTADKPLAWTRLSNLLQNWEHDGQKLGAITEWGEKDVLVIDTLTRAARYAMNFHQSLSGNLNKKPTLYDFGDAQGLVRSLLEILTAPEVRCNVVLNCHIDYGETKSGQPTEYPMSIGNALGPEIAIYFGSLLQIVKTRSGVPPNQKVTHVLRTVASSPLGVKTSIPFQAKPDYELETGLAQYFKTARGE